MTSDATQSNARKTGPSSLVVVGAGGGMGRWLCTHLLSRYPWSRVTLLDIDPAVYALGSVFTSAGVETATLDSGFRAKDAAGRPLELDLGRASSAVWLAVPQSRLPTVAGALLPRLSSDSVVFDISSAKLSALATLQGLRSDLPIVGVHPLFGPTVASLDGQEVVVCPAAGAPDAHEWLVRLVSSVGAIAKVTNAEQHDLVMAYVQAATHHALVTFADVLAHSGLSIENDLWEFRTPVFETLLGLAARTISPSQQATTASIQLMNGGSLIAPQFESARARLRAAVDSDQLDELLRYLEDVRGAFGGTFFAQLQEASRFSVASAQRTRVLLAEGLRTGRVVALEHRSGEKSRTVVGVVEKLDVAFVTVRELMAGPKGRAVLLTPVGRSNARALGVGIPRRQPVTRLGLSHVTPLGELQTEQVLASWLGRVGRDVRLLVPQAISAAGLVLLARMLPPVEEASVVAAELRHGQREVILRIMVRADNDPDEIPAALEKLIGGIIG